MPLQHLRAYVSCTPPMAKSLHLGDGRQKTDGHWSVLDRGHCGSTIYQHTTTNAFPVGTIPCHSKTNWTRVVCQLSTGIRFPRVLICRTYSFKMTLTSFRKAQRSPLCRHLEWARYKYSLTLHYIYWHLKIKMQISNFPK